MEYYRPITISNWTNIADRYTHLISNAGTLHAMSVPKEDYPWLIEQLGSDVVNATGKLHHTIRDAIIFFQVGNHTRGVHIDGYRANIPDFISALNIPINNCQDGCMMWFEGDYEQKLYDNPIGRPSIHLKWNGEPTVIDKVFIGAPMIVRVDKPHTVHNMSELPRCMLSIRFSPELL